jgi:hypothetical protein
MEVTIMHAKVLYMVFLCFTGVYLSSIISGCDEPTFQPPGDYISGYVFFVDTNFILGDGYYAVSLYRHKPQPFDTLPVSSDSIEMKKSISFSYAYYRVSSGYGGVYYVAVNWICIVDSFRTTYPVLGTLGCDTTRGCTEHQLIEFPNYTGASYDFKSWADTSKRLY